MMTQEIENADPRARARLIVAMVVLIAIGAAFVALLDSRSAGLSEWIVRDPARMRSRLMFVLVAMTAVVDLPLVGAVAYLWRFGARVARDGRLPPRGTIVIVDTPVLYGSGARRRGRILQAIAIVLAAAALWFAVMLWRLAALLEQRMT